MLDCLLGRVGFLTEYCVSACVFLYVHTVYRQRGANTDSRSQPCVQDSYVSRLIVKTFSFIHKPINRKPAQANYTNCKMYAPELPSENDFFSKLEKPPKTLTVAMTSDSAFWEKSCKSRSIQNRRGLCEKFLKPLLCFEDLLCAGYYIMVYCS